MHWRVHTHRAAAGRYLDRPSVCTCVRVPGRPSRVPGLQAAGVAGDADYRVLVWPQGRAWTVGVSCSPSLSFPFSGTGFSFPFLVLPVPCFSCRASLWNRLWLGWVCGGSSAPLRAPSPPAAAPWLGGLLPSSQRVGAMWGVGRHEAGACLGEGTRLDPLPLCWQPRPLVCPFRLACISGLVRRLPPATVVSLL